MERESAPEGDSSECQAEDTASEKPLGWEWVQYDEEVREKINVLLLLGLTRARL